MIRINLLPVRELRRQARMRRQLYIFGAAVAVVLIGVAVVWWSDQQAIGRLEAGKVRLNAEVAALKPIVDEVANLEKRQSLLNARLETIKRLRQNQRGPVRVLDTLSRNLPEQVWLEAIEESAGVYRVLGYALTNFAVADLLRNMQHSREFSGVDLISSEQAVIANRQIQKFSVRFQRIGGESQPVTAPSPVQRKPGT
jgi:type IV pilus assembly protein PilN